MMISTASLAEAQTMELPQPDLTREGSVMKALQERHSTREFSQDTLSMQDLSDLLWAANGINRPESGKRTAPSALNRQDVDIYVVTARGCYLYEATGHALKRICTGDYRPAVAGGQDFVREAPVSLVLVSDLSRMGNPADTGTQKASAIDAGIVSQNISIFCAAAHLATVPRMSMDEAALRKALQLKAEQQLMLNHPVGFEKD